MSKIVMTKKEFADLVSAKAAQEAIDCLAQTIDHMIANDDFKPEIFLPFLLEILNRLTNNFNRELAKHIEIEDKEFTLDDISIKDE